ncbi:MAG: GerMN domain-containing protein [Peptococcaceae bacterium]|nr:GerMN domain-containing protein [Peptococcaceae bacterium]
MKKTGIMLLAVFIVLTCCGCDRASETLAGLKEEFRQEVALNSEETQNQPDTLQLPDPDDITIEETYEPVQTIGAPVQEITVSLYFADAERKHLVKTEKRIPKVDGMARATVETLLEGPDEASGLVAAVPEGTQLLDINVKPAEKRCIVDFSQELHSQIADGNEQLAVYSIANTLCQFATIDTVEFRIEGQTVASLGGDFDLSGVIAANAEIVR